jgi:hypothetical protein
MGNRLLFRLSHILPTSYPFLSEDLGRKYSVQNLDDNEFRGSAEARASVALPDDFLGTEAGKETQCLLAPERTGNTSSPQRKTIKQELFELGYTPDGPRIAWP